MGAARSAGSPRRLVCPCGSDAEAAGQGATGTREREVLVDDAEVAQGVAADITIPDARGHINAASVEEALACV